ncbi:MAG: Mur ligase family protein, partial [Bradymonadaceae bacterium]
MSVANWLEYDRFAVYGLGRSGLAACRLLDRHGKDVLASDTASREELEETLEQLPGSVDVRLGENTPGGAEAVVLSPGLSPSTPAVDDLRGGDLPVLSEVDLAADASPAEIAAITGTDGKSTTTSMVGHIAAASGRAHEVAGNIGTPLSTVADGVGTEALLIAEISAFQLWSSRHLSPSVAAFTNVADDHLDYFDGDRDAYRRAKRRLADLCEASAIGVFNLEDDTVRSWAAE